MVNPAQKQEFEDPDGFPEPGDEGEDAIVIEVMDDTPLEDQRPAARPGTDDLDLDSEEFEAEVQNYSESAQKRIKQVGFKFHEERRAKETANRQTEEAIRYAEAVKQDNDALQQQLSNSNSVLVEQYTARSEAEMEAARVAFRDAQDDGDTDKILEAQENIARLHAERATTLPAASPTPDTVPNTEQPVYQPTPAAAPPVDQRAVKWLQDNPWFQQAGSEDMTGYAIGVHRKLIAAGLNPTLDERYYREIDQKMREVFPDKFSAPEQNGVNEVEVITPAATVRRSSPPVGGPSRGGAPPRKVQMTATQVSLAKRLGISNQQYAAQLLKEQEANG
jgi:hypothetical protein